MSKNLEELLLTVQKPGRYVGGEWNSVRKEWTKDKVKIALGFPDTYEVGMSYLGLKILYGILNDRDDCICERVFAPWPDFEEVLRTNDIRLFSLESRRALKEFDIIGFGLAYELSYTNVLNMLDLGGIPLRSSERGDSDPIVIVGGPSCYNPEPMAEFSDAFVIGDGEEVINELVDAYKGLRGIPRLCSGQVGQGVRKNILQEFAKIKGVYVPSLYKDGISQQIEKRIVKDLDSAYYPVRQIVPNIQVVHDRLVIEIMRGCKHACAFCQASSVYRPCRERSVETVLDIARRSYKATGYDEISLLSLSSIDHSRIKEMIVSLNTEFASKSVSVSVPSLRVEEALKDLPALVAKVKKSGLTFAPEAGSEKLRRVLNKNIDIDRLYAAIEESYRSGWNRAKLYFMIGLPGESDEDLSEIVDMAKKVSELRRKAGSGPAQVTVSINAFVPKPHTSMEHEPMADLALLEQKRRYLRDRLCQSRAIKLDIHSFDMSYLEAVFSRGDRRLSEVVYRAWSSGSRFDGWQEKFDISKWLAAFASAGVDPSAYALTRIPQGLRLPWDVITLRPPQFDNRSYI